MVGDGVIEDYVEAYKWANIAASKGSEGATQVKEKLRELMTYQDISKAQALSSEWVKNKGGIQ